MPPTCQSIVLPLLPRTLIVHREKKTPRCPLPLQLSTDSHFGTGHVLHSGKCCTGCQERVTPAGCSWTLDTDFVRVCSCRSEIRQEKETQLSPRRLLRKDAPHCLQWSWLLPRSMNHLDSEVVWGCRDVKKRGKCSIKQARGVRDCCAYVPYFDAEVVMTGNSCTASNKGKNSCSQDNIFASSKRENREEFRENPWR